MASQKGPATSSIDKAQDDWVEQASAVPKTHTAIERHQNHTPEAAAEIEKQLVRKIDLRILPFLLLIYICNYLDRNSITQARLYGLQEDTHTYGATYNTAISIFSAGYILMQIPASLLLPSVRPSIFLPACMIVWAIVSGCTATVSTPQSLIGVRFVLGFVEAPFFPGAVYFLSCWYTRTEIGKRVALLACGILLSNSFAGLISAGILSGMTSVTRLASWRWLFIIEGLGTIAIAVAALFCLPDYPATTRWLTEDERVVAQLRLARDAGAEDVLDEETTSVKNGFLWALKDRRVWLFGFLQMSATCGISFSHFFPTLIQELGFTNNTMVLLLTSPPYLVGFFWCIGLGWFADRKQTRSGPASTCVAVGMVSIIVLITVPHRLQWVRYAFAFPVACGTYGVFATTFAWLSTTIVRPQAKRAAAIGIANSLSNIASFYENYFWLDRYEPMYKVSWGVLLAFQGLALTCILSLHLILEKSNKRFEDLCTRISAGDAAQGARLGPMEQKAVVGGFRYVT